MEFIETYNLMGLIIGASAFLIIGMFHPITIKAEYYFGVKSWWAFLILGIAGIVASILLKHPILSPIAGVFAFSSFWTIKEIFEQVERVKKGWFPKNEKRYKKNKQDK